MLAEKFLGLSLFLLLINNRTNTSKCYPAQNQIFVIFKILDFNSFLKLKIPLVPPGDQIMFSYTEQQQQPVCVLTGIWISVGAKALEWMENSLYSWQPPHCSLCFRHCWDDKRHSLGSRLRGHLKSSQVSLPDKSYSSTRLDLSPQELSSLLSSASVLLGLQVNNLHFSQPWHVGSVKARLNPTCEQLLRNIHL